MINTGATVTMAAELLIRHRSKHHCAKLRKLAPDNGEDLEAVHFGHLQVANQQPERLGFQHGEGAPSAGSGVELWLSGHLPQDLPIHLQQIRVIIQEQDLCVTIVIISADSIECKPEPRDLDIHQQRSFLYLQNPHNCGSSRQDAGRERSNLQQWDRQSSDDTSGRCWIGRSIRVAQIPNSSKQQPRVTMFVS
jgi:hypothetical protein